MDTPLPNRAGPLPPATTIPADAPLAVNTQRLPTEHRSLLAIRSMTWSEIFSRQTLLLTVLSGALVRLIAGIVEAVTGMFLGAWPSGCRWRALRRSLITQFPAPQFRPV